MKVVQLDNHNKLRWRRHTSATWLVVSVVFAASCFIATVWSLKRYGPPALIPMELLGQLNGWQIVMFFCGLGLLLGGTHATATGHVLRSEGGGDTNEELTGLSARFAGLFWSSLGVVSLGLLTFVWSQ